jgi:dTDP-4-amino-4,6-dideoxygalactose transaminase
MNSKERIFLSPPYMSGNELTLINEAFSSNYIAPLGPMVDRFEADFCVYTGYDHCVALSSGTAALHLALLGIGIKPGDHVWASALTFMGSVSPITFCNAVPTFVDSSISDWNIDLDLLEENIPIAAKKNELPKAVLVTDLYGQLCDYPRLQRICENYDIKIISDSAEALGASCNGSKSLPEISAYSFNGNKIITTSGGGMLASNNKSLIDYAKFLSQQARDPVPYYQHTVIGYNYRMSNILAAIGVAQLQILDERINQKKKIYQYYCTQLSDIEGISFMPLAQDRSPNYWLSVMVVDKKTGIFVEDLRLALEKENIEARNIWKPMHLQPVFSQCNIIGGHISEQLFETGLCLPSGAAMQQQDQDRVIKIIKKAFNKAC